MRTPPRPSITPPAATPTTPLVAAQTTPRPGPICHARRRQPPSLQARGSRPSQPRPTPTTRWAGKASQPRSYDSATGDLTLLNDSIAGTFTASYNADGHLAREDLPDGVSAITTYDETGAATKVDYQRSGCSSNCGLYNDQATAS